MNMEELSTALFVEIYTASKDEHIRKRWMIGLDGVHYKNEEELKTGVMKWLESEDNVTMENNNG